MNKKMLLLVLSILIIVGICSKVKTETISSQNSSQITIHVENKENTPYSSSSLNKDPQQSKRSSTFNNSKLPLTNAQKQQGFLVGFSLLLIGVTCFFKKLKRGKEYE